MSSRTSFRDRAIPVRATILATVACCLLLNAPRAGAQWVAEPITSYPIGSSVAYSPDTGGFLVTWFNCATAAAAGRLWGQIIRFGQPSTASFPIGAEDPSFWTTPPGIAYSTASHEFLVVWQGAYGSANEIHARRVRYDGAILSDIINVTNDGGNYWEAEPSVGYNPTTNEFVVVYTFYDNLANYGTIRMNRVQAGTGAVSAPIDVSAPNAGPHVAKAVYNGVTGNMLVAWTQSCGASCWASNGQLLNSAGAKVGGIFPVSSYYAAYDALNIAHNANSNTFMLVTHSRGSEDAAVELNGNGTPWDNGFIVTNTAVWQAADGVRTGGNYFPAIAAHPARAEFMMSTSTDFKHVIGQRIFTNGAGGGRQGESFAVSGIGPFNGVPLEHSGIAFDPQNNVYLVIVDKSVLQAQFVSQDGAPIAWAPGGTVPPPGPTTITLRVNVNGNGSVVGPNLSCGANASCSVTYAQNAAVTLTPAAASGWTFAGWTGDGDCTDAVLTMDSARSCTASFLPVMGVTARSVTDFSGDGVGDAFLYNKGTGGWFVAYNNISSVGYASGQWSPGFTVKAARLNGDGFMDLVVYNPVTGDGWNVINNGAGGFTYIRTALGPGWTIYPARLDGNVYDDLFLFNAQTGAWREMLSDGAGHLVAGASGNWSPGWQVSIVDLNGDGLDDVFVYNRSNGSWYRCINVGSGAFVYTPGFWSPNWGLAVGDFNGDGTDDIIVYDRTSGIEVTCLSTPQGFVYMPAQLWSPGLILYPGDFNGDGRKDVFAYSPTTGIYVEVFSDGRGNFVNAGGGSWSAGWEVHVGEVNGDHVDDILVYDPNSGAFFRCMSNGAGAFFYTGGQWSPGWTIVTSR